MRNLFVLLMIAFTSCTGENKAYEFRNDVIDLGLINSESNAEANFVFYNIGDTPLEIERILTDCHCTVANYPKKEISAGDSALIKIKYDKNKEGFFEQTASVYFFDFEYPQLLILRGEVEN